MANDLEATKEIIQQNTHDPVFLSWCTPQQGYVEIGAPGNASCLYAAMCFAQPDIVTALLKAGADPTQLDVMGNDALIAGSGFGRAENIDVWFEKLPNWNVNRSNIMFGATASHLACSMGRRKLQTLCTLVRHGANLNPINSMGSSLLHDAVSI